jgi:uncharacterized membrane protein
MMNKLSAIEKMLAVSLGFTMMLLAFRIFYAGNINYIFYVWNLFLAVVPLMLSRKLQSQETFSRRTIFILIAWILFLPNAPYVVTDLFHYKERWPVPKWYDLLLVTSAAWNGLMAGFISVMQAEQFLSRLMSKRKTQLAILLVFFLCGYGIYIGRFLRFNSWDVITDPFQLLIHSGKHFLLPHEYLSVWKFTVLFALMLVIIYHTLKQFSLIEKHTVKEN